MARNAMFIARALILLGLAMLGAPASELAPTPPMGFSTWYAFGPNINETNVLQIARVLVSSGLKNLGYEYVLLDDNWMAPQRDRYGNIYGDPARFPSGMKALAERIHDLGLKFGLYGCVGPFTCLGLPGQFGHEYQDAHTITEWGVDYWKMDNCYEQFSITDIYQNKLLGYNNTYTFGLDIEGLSQHAINYRNISSLPHFRPQHGGQVSTGREEAFKLFGDALKATGRPILYSVCPMIAGCDLEIAKYYRDNASAHMSMNQCPQIDNNDAFSSTLAHFDDYARNGVSKLARPGYWNDLDFLMLGYKYDPLSENPPAPPGQYQTKEEYRTQIALFCITAAPMIISADIRGTTQNNTFSSDMRELLMNPEVLAVNQDKMGKAGDQVADGVWSRHLADGSLAVVLLNREKDVRVVSFQSWTGIGLHVPRGASVDVRNVLSRKTISSGADPEKGWSETLQSHHSMMLRAWAAPKMRSFIV